MEMTSLSRMGPQYSSTRTIYTENMWIPGRKTCFSFYYELGFGVKVYEQLNSPWYWRKLNIFKAFETSHEHWILCLCQGRLVSHFPLVTAIREAFWLHVCIFTITSSVEVRLESTPVASWAAWSPVVSSTILILLGLFLISSYLNCTRHFRGGYFLYVTDSLCSGWWTVCLASFSQV